MATVTYVNNDYSVLAQAMQQLVTMGYFDSVEYDSENDAVVCKDADENAVLTLAKSTASTTPNPQCNITFRLDNGTTKTAIAGGGSGAGVDAIAMIGYIYICSGGAYICSITSSSTVSMHRGFIFISKTNNEKIGIVFTPYATSGFFRYNFSSWATDDDTVQMNTIFSSATPALRNQETLFNIPTSAAVNTAPSYFPDVYTEFTTMTTYSNNTDTPPVSATVDGKNYLWVGYFMIADEEG